MTSFPHLLRNRQLGLPGAQRAIEKGVEEVIAQNLVSDRFHSKTIELPQNSDHKIVRCKDLAAVLSVSRTLPKVQSLALWSLSIQSKLWDIEIDPNYTDSNPGSCLLSEHGMVVVDSKPTEGKKIVFNGKLTGVLPKLRWQSIVAIGNRILSCWTEPRELSENVDHFFGEWDMRGESLSRYQLDNTKARGPYQYACSEDFWVRLSASSEADLASIIEVIDRITGTMKTFELPLNQDDEEFSDAYIVQNRLFYGKNVVRLWTEFFIPINYEPTICIYDLVKGEIVGEFPTGAESGYSKGLVANQKYAAWLEYRGRNNDRVQYLDMSNKELKVATTAPYYGSNVVFDIVGSILSVTYASQAYWHRKVIDMSSCEMKCDFRYRRDQLREFSISNGDVLTTDEVGEQPRMHVESFSFAEPSDAEPSFRC